MGNVLKLQLSRLVRWNWPKLSGGERTIQTVTHCSDLVGVCLTLRLSSSGWASFSLVGLYQFVKFALSWVFALTTAACGLCISYCLWCVDSSWLLEIPFQITPIQCNDRVKIKNGSRAKLPVLYPVPVSPTGRWWGYRHSKHDLSLPKVHQQHL